MSRIRILKPGERVPPGEPRRYGSTDGYVRLRWRVGKDEYVEVREHRVFDGVVTTAAHVHHRNHQRDDNRPENLLAVTTTEHGAHHRVLDDAEVARRYLSGESTITIARALGVNTATVTRSLQRSGTPTRPPADTARRTDIDSAYIGRLYLSGRGIETIAAELGCSTTMVCGRLKELGIKLRPPGRQPVQQHLPLSSAVLSVTRVEKVT